MPPRKPQPKKKPSSKPSASYSATTSVSTSSRASASSTSTSTLSIPIPAQQKLLTLLSTTLSPTLGSPSFPARLQSLKGALYARDFAAAFGDEDNVAVYAARWSPGRALCYAGILVRIREHLDGLVQCGADASSGASAKGAAPTPAPAAASATTPPTPASANDASPVGSATTATTAATAAPTTSTSASSTSPPTPPAPKPLDHELKTLSLEDEKDPKGLAHPSNTSEVAQEDPSLKIVCIGGTAAELAALALFRSLTPSPSSPASSKPLSLTLIDSAPWSTTLSDLYTALTSPPPITPYDPKPQPPLLTPSSPSPSPSLSYTFIHSNIFSLPLPSLLPLNPSTHDPPVLLTLLFTLNELYAASLSSTTSLLLSLSARVPHGSLLLVVDSPGSYSEASVGKQAKRYPMRWLLDHTLGQAGEAGCRWEKLLGEESTWFRLAAELRYPIPLEDMRYQLHLYRASKPAS